MTSKTDTRHILIIDDEAMIREVVGRYIEREGWQVSRAADGLEGWKLATTLTCDLVVLDLMLPKLDGLEVCRRLRAISTVPIIILTARSEDTEKIVGLSIGADDYLTKPFSPGELVARIKAVLRRVDTSGSTPTSGDSETLRLGSIYINPRTRIVERDGQIVNLTAKEFDLLWFLARHPGQVFTRDQLLNDVWDYSFMGDASTVTVHVRRLREKFEPDPMRPRHIKTVWGVGYKFER